MSETATQELSLDAQLEALAKDSAGIEPPPGSTPEGDSAAPSPKSPQPDSPDPATPPDQPAEPTLEEQLDKLEVPEETPEPELEEISSEQQQILQAFPTLKDAQEVATMANGYANFTGALQSGNFESVEQMLEAWNPAIADGLKDYFYAKYVNNGEWIDRWIGEKEGRGPINREVSQLQGRIKQLEQQVQSRNQENEQSQRNAQEEQALRSSAQNLVNHLNGLFDTIKFSAADRPWVLDRIYSQIRSNPQVAGAIRNGNVKAANAVFKDVVKAYVGRDKAASEGTAAQLAAQERHKAPAASSPAVETGAVESDYSKVSGKDQNALENAMDAQLAALAKKARR